MTQTIQVSLWRGRARGRYQVYEVPLRENQTVLDVVTFVQRTLDPTLAYRFACRVGMCGSCAMTVNGRPRWTCRTHVAKVAAGGKLEIGPPANLPVIKDLATDMQPFFWLYFSFEHDLFGKPVSTFPDHAMNEPNYRDEIVRLEEQIDELAARIESCRKFILAGRIAVIGGGAVLVAILIGALEFNPSVMAGGVAGGVGGAWCA